MKTESTNTVIILNDTPVEHMTFVNEECGDTMWDEVLKIWKANPKNYNIVKGLINGCCF